MHRTPVRIAALALGLHLLVVDDGAHAVLHRARDLLHLALRALGCLRGLLLRLALLLLHGALGLHLLVADQLANALLQLATDLLGGTFCALALVAHDVSFVTL